MTKNNTETHVVPGRHVGSRRTAGYSSLRYAPVKPPMAADPSTENLEVEEETK